MRRFTSLFSLILFLLASTPRPAVAQALPVISTNSARLEYPAGITFELAASADERIESVVLRYGTDGRACQRSGSTQPVEITPGQTVTASWEWEFRRSGSLPPGVRVWWQWEIRTAGGQTHVTEQQWLELEDDRHTWQRLSRGGVKLNWYRGNAAFGQALLGLAHDALQRLADEAGIAPPENVSITVYPTADELRDVLLHLPEWTGGVAFPEHNSTVIGIAPGQLDWAAEVLPHELAHLVTGALAFNCRGGDLPTWLDEGLAGYAEGEPWEGEADLLDALQAGDLPPLASLASGFSADDQEARLAYAHSGAIVRYLLQTYGPERMAALIAALRDGQTTNRALQQVYGLDSDGLDSAWRQASGGPALPTAQPTSAQARTAVPTLALWTAIPAPTAAATAAPPSVPPVSPTPAPSPTSAPTAVETLPPPASPWPVWAVWGGAAMLLVLLALAGLWARRRTG